MNKRTKIVCTLGPSCNTEEQITKMVEAGMNVVRLNFSHGTYDTHLQLFKNVRVVEEATGEPIPIMQDLQGPKIRLGVLPEQGVTLVDGAMITFDTSLVDYVDGILPIDYRELHQFLKPGERILLDDGRVETRVVRVNDTRIDAEVVVGGRVSSHKGINVPDTSLNIRSLTEKDKEDLRFGVVHELDFVAISFVRGPEDVLDVRYCIKQYEDEVGKKPDHPIQIIAKIERHEAVENIREILSVADGIMVARGDLGVEIRGQEVPLVQKKLIDLAREAGKPVIVATQMLDSMQQHPRPTRAEVSDVANAVIDHTDAVMLSNETATGKYPVLAVKTMADIIIETEKSSYDNFVLPKKHEKHEVIDEVISQLSRVLAERIGARLIVSSSLTGETGRMISKYRPELPIIVGAISPRVLRQLNFSWGVYPFLMEECSSIEELVDRALVYVNRRRMAKKGDSIIIVAGEPVGQSGKINLLEVRQVE